MIQKSYKIAKWFEIANYLFIPVSFAFAIMFGYIAFIEWIPVALGPSLISIFMAIFFIFCGIYSIRILPQFKEIIHITNEQILQEHIDKFSTSIRWDENFGVKHRPFLGRLDLISQDGQRIIKIEQQLGGYNELIKFISTKMREKEKHELIKT
jgi:hypothetical protein